MTRVVAGPVSFELSGEWSVASVVLIAPRVDGPVLLTAKPQTQYRANLVVQVEPTEGLPLDRLAEVHRERLSSSVSGFESLSSEELVVAGKPAVLREHRFVDAGGYHLQQLELLLLLSTERALHGLASDHRGSFEQNRERFFAALAGLRLDE